MDAVNDRRGTIPSSAVVVTDALRSAEAEAEAAANLNESLINSK